MYEEKANFKEGTDETFRRVRGALLNVLEDTDEARKEAVNEKNKTMAIVENLTDGILLLNNKNVVEIISHPVVDFFKKDEKDIVGQDIRELLKGEDFKALRELLMSEEDKNIKIVHKQEVSVAKNMDLELTTVFLSKEGEVLIIFHDITGDKLVEKMKTEFVSIAAHQLRTPLSAIKWTLRMVLDGDVGELEDDQKELLEKTYISNERMISLINDLLNISRIEEGKFLYRQEPGQLEDVVKAIVEGSQELLKMKKMKLSVDIPKEKLPDLNIDKEKVGIAVQNLLENAVKYTPEGGSIHISLEKIGREIIFKIKDTGVGIPGSDHKRIFTKFFRGDNIIKMETEGSGLGLYTTKNIIEAHQGKIWFESKEGEGTTFYFSIPIDIDRLV
ncbi:MAG: ATP-binding protein [Candidatus Paceibacterota bacterium]|jgi:signal transduction histidine kinase